MADGAARAFVAGPLVLEAGVTLWVDAGAILWASADPRDYDRGGHTCGALDRAGGGCRPFIAVAGGEGGGIVGDGTIDGRGNEAMAGRDETWWQLARRAQREGLHQNAPRLIEVDGARDFRLYRIRLKNSPNFHVVLKDVDGFTAWGVKIDAPADSRNTDGIDPMSSRNVSVVSSFIRTGDDGVAIKAARRPSEGITVADSHFYNGHGISIGSETAGGVRRVRVERVTMEGSTSGLRIKSDVSRGGAVRDVRYSDACLRNVARPIDITTRYDPKAVGAAIPSYDGISLDRIHVMDGDDTGEATPECQGRMPAFPEEGAAKRPQLDASQAKSFGLASVLRGWDPLAESRARGGRKADYVVDAAGGGDFTTIQAAVSAAVGRARESSRGERIEIQVNPGTYRELVYVPEASAPITLRGMGEAGAVRIVATLDAALPGARYAERFAAQFESADPAVRAMFEAVRARGTIGTAGSAVAWIRNRGFRAEDLAIANGYNKERGDFVEEGGRQSQAVAALVDDADLASFENVRFEGFQDTLYLRSSTQPAARAFFHRAYVEGDMDFIFGEATAYFLESEIRTLGDRRVSYTLAPSTHVASPFGLVFERCNFTHDGSPNAAAGTFKLARQWFRGQRCTPYAPLAGAPGYDCTLGATDAPATPRGTVSRGALEAVGKVAILDSRLGRHFDAARPWADWNAAGTRAYRPAQFDSSQYWDNLVAAGIDPVRDLGYAAREDPPRPFLVEYNNR
ncbi:MAG TPA: pectinesterase family protein [Usitatibacter sp.]|nr:pectinesterase family protein [Usitatibacter sp.]